MSSNFFGGILLAILIGVLLLPIIIIFKNGFAMYPTKGTVEKKAKTVSAAYKKKMDAFIEKSGGNHWGTCESCDSVYDTRKYSRCPSCGWKLIKTYKIKMSFTPQQLKEYRNCLNYLPMASSNDVLFNATGILTQYRLVKIGEFLSKLTNENADSFEFTCDFCGSKIHIGNHNCPNCGAPFGKDKEFAIRNKIIIENAGISILEEDYGELFMDSEHQIRQWMGHGRNWTPPYLEDMNLYINSYCQETQGAYDR